MQGNDDILPLAGYEDGWLCPNCLVKNKSDRPEKDDVLTCSECKHVTLVE
jgi:hypothetical protein